MSSRLLGLSLRDLEYAVAVGKERHFGRAAESCGVSQAALSEQVRKLEGVLGVTLFERTKRRVDPTARGRAVLEQAEALLGEARRLLDDARRSAEPLTGTLRLGVIATLGPYYLPAILPGGRARFPQLNLRLREGRTEELLAALRNGELDAALLALPVTGDGLLVEPLFFEPFRLACPLDDALAARPEIRLRDLPRGKLLLMEEGHCMREQAIALCHVRRLDPHTRFASSLEMLRHMIAAGEGYSVLPLMATGDHADMNGLIAFRDIADADAGRRIGLVWRATETRSDDLRQVAAYMRESLPPGTLPLAGGAGGADGASGRASPTTAA
jgi:LysR family hydrogen peroxide-inducible transcriptional activator